MKLEARDDQVEAKVKERLKEMEANGQYDMSQSSQEYNKIIQKLEAEVRNHISVSGHSIRSIYIFHVSHAYYVVFRYNSR